MRQKANKGKVGSVRQKALDFADLRNMERHGKREDESGKRRKIREEDPLVYGSLELRERRSEHMEGVKQSGRSACLHAFVQFPTELIDARRPEQQQAMLDHAVKFLNEYHGGDAVFAARLDRDEKGRHGVDVFLMPRYDFHYKDGRTVKKASVSKFSKAEAKRRFGRDDRRSQGSALQDAWFEYLRDEMQLEGVMPPQRKKATAADRLEPEAYGLRQDKARHSENVQRQAKRISEQARAIRDQKSALRKERALFEKEKAAARPALDLVKRTLARLKDRKAVATVATFEKHLREQERLPEPPQRSRGRSRGLER